MRQTVIPLSLGLCLFIGAPTRDSAADDPTEIPAHFEVLAPLVGPVWSASFPGTELRDLQRFEWMLGGRFLRNTHQVVGPDDRVVYEGETVYGFDHEEKRIRWWYFNATGGHVVGTLELDGERLIAIGRNNGPDGQVARVRSDVRIEEGAWTSTAFEPDGDRWIEKFTLTFEPVDTE